ncbi:MAG: methionyl-tRNA formyltransferase [Gammaproteobacteria bacterium]|nr:MAG: methionyl-tRNA formyltransferase [Gammaproteobacteria bacterium]
MKIMINGQQAFGKTVLEALLERGEEVVGVYCEPDKGDRIDPIKEAASEHNLPLFQPKSFKKPDVWEQMGSLEADLCVMAYVTLIVPQQALDVPTLGSIQYHPSLLPLHRGPSAINWPIIQGDEKTGLSIFWPDNGLDTGPILMQKEVAIRDDDTLGSLYFNHLFPMGVEAILESVDLVRDGKAPKIVQDESRATYEGWCREQDVEIDWNRPTQEVWNLIRGANPQPGAWTRHGDTSVKIFDCAKQPAARGATPGQVTAAGDDGISVACADGQIQIHRLRAQGAKKMTAAEYLADAALAVGDRLGS